MKVINEQALPLLHTVNIGDRLVISAYRPLGRCKRSGEYVYPSVVEGYSAFSPELDEDLYDFEWRPIENKKEKNENEKSEKR